MRLIKPSFSLNSRPITPGTQEIEGLRIGVDGSLVVVSASRRLVIAPWDSEVLEWTWCIDSDDSHPQDIQVSTFQPINGSVVSVRSRVPSTSEYLTIEIRNLESRRMVIEPGTPLVAIMDLRQIVGNVRQRKKSVSGISGVSWQQDDNCSSPVEVTM